MKIVGISHIGNSRSNQEDNFLIGERCSDLTDTRKISQDSPCVALEQENGCNNVLLAVSDGMGGHASGEVASYMTVKYFSDNYAQICDSEKDSLTEIIAELNREVAYESLRTPEYKGMGATLCGFLCKEDKILGFNVGDSRLYRFENGALQQLSRDHTEGQRLLDLKLLNEQELKSFPKRKAIYKHIGMKIDLVADVFDIDPCEAETVLLLCTDGLCDVLGDLEIQGILAEDISLAQKGEKMLNIALSRNVGYGDNITIILTEF